MKRERRKACIIPMCTYWKNKIELDTYVQVKTLDGISYGGNQNWFAAGDKDRRGSVLSEYGCGLVALGDFFLAAGEQKEKLKPSLVNGCFRPYGTRMLSLSEPLGQKRYLAYLSSLCRYLQILPRIGANAWQLQAGAWWYIRRSGCQVKMHWSVFPWNLVKRIQSMLTKGLPVIFCVGPNLNPFDRKLQVPMYQLLKDDLVKRCDVRGHYMTITGLCQDAQGVLFLQVASWGKKYYIRFKDYQAYQRKQPPFLGNWLSNILYMELE